MSPLPGQRSAWRSPWAVMIALGAGALGGLALHLATPTLGPELTALLLTPIDLIADIFLRLLRMLVAPLVLFSIMSGMVGIGDPRRLSRLGLRTFAYYMGTSLVAIVTGMLLVNLIRPGIGADLALPEATAPASSVGALDILRRLVPENIFDALVRLDMLQIIFFALLAGFAITTLPDRHREVLSRGAESLFELMTRLAHVVLGVLPVAVFALLFRIVAHGGVSRLGGLGWYFMTVLTALLIHGLLTLPLIARLLAGVSPRRWAAAVGQALITAFSTSSSSATLPVTLETVEKKGGVSNEVSSFVLPLGATINMDGTALYECIATIFIAQYYASSSGYELTVSRQLMVVFTALLASIGAAGIPSAGLVMMTVILQALDLPLEGALLVAAVDRPLDMVRTAINVWSDTIGAAVIGRYEGSPPLPDEA
ncbi:MAG TPA: dicarboxylate/amino acid:cation symporter [Acidobacteria bacterium]|nr:dicarboxylate/amino acid:cation symporter [Acidobacteriota bacterium]